MNIEFIGEAQCYNNIRCELYKLKMLFLNEYTHIELANWMIYNFTMGLKKNRLAIEYNEKYTHPIKLPLTLTQKEINKIRDEITEIFWIVREEIIKDNLDKEEVRFTLDWVDGNDSSLIDRYFMDRLYKVGVLDEESYQNHLKNEVEYV